MFRRRDCRCGSVTARRIDEGALAQRDGVGCAPPVGDTAPLDTLAIKPRLGPRQPGQPNEASPHEAVTVGAAGDPARTTPATTSGPALGAGGRSLRAMLVVALGTLGTAVRRIAMLVVALGTLATAVRRIAMMVVAAVSTLATAVRRIAILVVALGTVPAVARRIAIARWIDSLPAHLRRGLRRVVVLTALLPLIVLLAVQVPLLPNALVLVGYGVLVLAATIAMMYLGYARYEDPSVHPVPPRPAQNRWLRGAGAESRTFPALPADPAVSLLVAVRDELEGIEQCVRTMVGSDYPNLEVIVVDDASTDGTPEVLRRLSAELGITVLYKTVNRGKKHALTEGVSIASGQVLAFTDSDCVLAPDALSRCVHALVTNPDFGAVSGHGRALNADDTVLTRAQDTWYDGQFRVAKAAEATFGSVTCVSGPLAVFRRDAIVNYLPAWANDTFLGREFRFATDRQLTGYVLGQVWKGRELKRRYADSPLVADQDYPERHWRVGYVRSAHVWTTVPARVRPFLKQQVRWKKSFIRNLCFTGSFMWRRGPGAAAMFYGHALFVAVAPLMAVRHLVWAPANGLFLLTALYLCGVLTKGFAWAIAFKISNPGTSRWRYRPLISLLGSVLLAWLLPYSLFTIRRGTWSRGAE